jgi:hypothetical protein
MNLEGGRLQGDFIEERDGIMRAEVRENATPRPADGWTGLDVSMLPCSIFPG